MSDHEPPAFPDLSQSPDDSPDRAEPSGPLFSRPVAAVDETVGAEAPIKVTPTSSSWSTTMNSRWRWAAVGIATVLVVGLLGAVFVLAGPRAGTPSTVAGYAPANAAMYAEVRLDLPGDQRAQLASFMSHFPGFADQAAFDTKLNDMLDSLARESQTGLDWQADVASWFGGQIGVFTATLSADMGTPQSMTLALSVKDRTALDQLLTRLGADPSTSTSDYQGVTIYQTSFASGGERVSVAATDEVLLIGTRLEDVQAALDVHANRATGLADDQFFLQQLGALHADRLATFYLDYGSLITSMPSQMPVFGPGCFEDLSSQMTNFKFVGEMRAESDHLVLAERVQAPTGGNLPAPAANGPSTLAQSAPANTVAYYEMRQLGPTIKALVGEMLNCASANGGSFDPKAIETFLGTPLQDYFDFLGDAAVVVSYANGKYGAGIIATVDDQAVANARVDRLVGTLSGLAALGNVVTVDKQQHGDATITVITPNDLPPGMPFSSLAVTVAGGRLYIGLDDFVTSALDRTAADSLATTPRFKAGLAAGGTDNTGVLFVDIAALRGNIEGMVPAAELSDYDANVKPFVEPLDYLMMVGRNDNGVGVSNVFLYVK